jgi:hypothetical protein
VRKPVDGEFARDYLYIEYIEDAVDSYLAMSDGLDAGVAVGQAYNFAMGWSFADGLSESVGWYTRHLADDLAAIDRLPTG